MTVGYKGRNSFGVENRFAEIFFNHEDSKELELFNRLMFFMNRIKGWNIKYEVAGWAYCVIEDRDEYSMFVADYKEAKKMIKDCMKFGF